MVVVVEIKSGQGSGLANPMVNHLFDSLDQATEYIWELLGFSSASLYVNPRWNAFAPFTQEFCDRHIFGLDLNKGYTKYFCFGPHGTTELNAMAIFLGYRVDDGLSRFLNARGDAFFVGLTASHQPVTSNVLWDVANLLCEAMQYFPGAELEGSKKKGRKLFASGVESIHSERGSQKQAMPA